MAETSVVIIDESESEVIDVDKEYETEEGEIEELSTKSDVQCPVQVLSQSEPETVVTPPVQPTFEVTFRNKSEYEKLGEAVINALKGNETLGEPKFEYVISGCCIQAFGIETCTLDVSESKGSPVYEIDCDGNSNDSTDFGADLNKLFTIDPSPATKLEIAEVPSYKRHSRDVLDDEVKPKLVKKDENACQRPKPTTACFNCGAFDHGIRDCPMPRNNQRIARAKKARASKGERYHVDVDQRFAHLKPGEISEKLRKALALRKNELPGFFLRMRTCGYPPGWLEECKVSHSGLAMFNTGDDVLKCEEDSNESDIKFDISKIIEFPGFNVMPEGYRDDYKYYNVPPYSGEYSKEAMIAALGDAAIKGFKRKKLKDHNEGTQIVTEVDLTASLNVEDGEMEIDDNIEEKNVEFTRPLPPPIEDGIDSPPPLPPLPPQENDEQLTPPSVSIETNENLTPALASNETNEKLSLSSSPLNKAENSVAKPASLPTEALDADRSKSPTLEELQAKQRDLLLKLTNGDDDLLNETVETNIVTATCNTPATPETPLTPATPLPDKVGVDLQNIIKTSHIGTPVLKFSPFDKIPDTDNFKVGVSDVINFENLPDSTGKYEAMKEVIHKVRLAKKRLAEEDD